MERSILSLVNQANLEGRLRSNPIPMFFPNFFGIKEVSTLTWKTLVGEQGVPVIADVISFDSSAPQKGREVDPETFRGHPKDLHEVRDE